MALFIAGMKCPISGKSLTTENAVSIPAFVPNKADPLYMFSDAVLDRDTFEAHQMYQLIMERLRPRVTRAVGPNTYICFICEQNITDPEHYLGLGHLTAIEGDDLHKFNHAHFHKQCLSKWDGTLRLHNRLIELDASHLWKGDSLEKVILLLGRLGD